MWRCITLLLLFGLLFPLSSCAHKNNKSPEALAFQAKYGELAKIKHFGHIAVNVNGDAEKVGLNDQDLTEYARLRFRNNFSSVVYEEVSDKELKTLSTEKIGVISCRVWVVGENYPLAYHVKCDEGNFKNSAIWSDEVLGYGAKSNSQETVKKSINEMMEKLALTYFKVKGELG